MNIVRLVVYWFKFYEVGVGGVEQVNYVKFVFGFVIIIKWFKEDWQIIVVEGVIVIVVFYYDKLVIQVVIFYLKFYVKDFIIIFGYFCNNLCDVVFIVIVVVQCIVGEIGGIGNVKQQDIVNFFVIIQWFEGVEGFFILVWVKDYVVVENVEIKCFAG